MAMKTAKLLLGLGLGGFLSAFSFAQAPADAPAGTTGLCKDGSYISTPTKRGACHGHKGVQDWYGSAPAAAAAPAPAAAPAAPAAASAPAPAAPAAPVAKSSSGSKYTPPATAAAGGGPGLVWVNTNSKVYHCPGDRWYGKTKKGEYVSEATAKANGDRPDHGKECGAT
jgi:hypothetical protein